MKCPRCQRDLVGDARFCGTCGYALSVPEDEMSAARPSSLAQGDNEATLMSAWPDTQPVAPQARTAAQTYQAAPWQTPREEHTQLARSTGMATGTMKSAGRLTRPVGRRRRGRVSLRILLTLLLLLAILAAVWFVAVRPSLHSIVQTQLDQALNGAEGQMILFQAALPAGNQVVHIDESIINNYLNVHDLNPLQNLHATITTSGLRLDFGAYGFTSDIIVVPIASQGALEVTNVQVQGVLWLVMSDDELTTALNTNFQSFGRQMNRAIRSITLHNHEMDIRIQ
jgi:hypothetical protein